MVLTMQCVEFVTRYLRARCWIPGYDSQANLSQNQHPPAPPIPVVQPFPVAPPIVAPASAAPIPVPANPQAGNYVAMAGNPAAAANIHRLLGHLG